MTRARFWITQFIWLMAAGISVAAATDGDGEAVPVILFGAFLITAFTNRWGARKDKNEDATVTGYNGHLVARIMTTAFIWLTYMGGSVAAVMEMAGWGVLLALVLMIPAITFTALLWSWERIAGVVGQQANLAQNHEKRKRQSVDDLLGNLSEGDLDALRDRLGGHRVESDTHTHMQRGISDDGELIYFERRG